MILRHVVIVLALALIPSAAYADCESEAGKARENILASGPFHYSSRQWNKNFDRLQVGMIESNKAEHIVESTQDGQRGPEEIYIDTQSWENDGFGWLPPRRSLWSHQFTVPKSPYQALKTKCLGEVEVEAKTLIGYEVEARITPPHVFLEKIFVDPNNGLTVRYERTGDAPEAINVVTTYRYDASIKIEPPQIDLASRKAKSLQAFQLAVDSTDAKCRQEVIDTIDHGQAALPFRYQMAGNFWSGVSGMHGTFVPPSSVHNAVDGIPTHGGGSETVMIGNRAWTRLAGQKWVQTSSPSPMAGAVSASWSGALFFLAMLMAASRTTSEAPRASARWRKITADIASMNMMSIWIPKLRGSSRRNGGCTLIRGQAFPDFLKILAMEVRYCAGRPEHTTKISQ